MTAVAAPGRKTERRLSPLDQRDDRVGDSGEEFFAGGMVAIDAADGELVVVTASTTLLVCGRAIMSAVGDGAKHVGFDEGCFFWDNSSAGEAIGADDIGKIAYAKDSATVGISDLTGTLSPAGIVMRVTGSQVEVQQSLLIAALLRLILEASA